MRWRRAADRPQQDGDKDEQVQQPAQVLELVQARHGLIPRANSVARRGAVGAMRLRALPDASMEPCQSVRRRTSNIRSPTYGRRRRTPSLRDLAQTYSGSEAPSAAAAPPAATGAP